MMVLRLEGSSVDVGLLEILKSLSPLNVFQQCASKSVSCQILETRLHTKCVELVFTPSSVEPSSPHPRLVWNMFAS